MGAIGRMPVGIGAVGTADVPPIMIPLGFARIIDLSAVRGIEPPIGSNVAILAAEFAAVRFRDDGQDPSGTVGIPLSAGAAPLPEIDLSTIRFIEQAPGAILSVLFYQLFG